MKEIIFLTKGEEAPSFRYRLKPLIVNLRARGYKCRILLVNNSNYVWRIWKHRHHLKLASAIICHKLLLPKIETNLLSSLNKHTFLDIDDAIYLKEPKWVGHERPLSKTIENKFKNMVSSCMYVVAGNQHLKNKVSKLGGNPKVFPTGIDTNLHVQPKAENGSICRIVWIGLPTNLRYLEVIHNVFLTLNKKHPNIRLRIICSEFPQWDEVKMEKIFWSKSIEKQALAEADIGIMPLDDSEYSKGKCAFKLLQYMAAGLPCIASPVGANIEVVRDNETGFLASTEKEWIDKLSILIESPEKRKAMGKKGKNISLTEYSQDSIAERYADFITGNLKQ